MPGHHNAINTNKMHMNRVSLRMPAVLVVASLLLPSATPWSTTINSGSSLAGRGTPWASRFPLLDRKYPIQSQRRSDALVLSVQATVDMEDPKPSIDSGIDEASASALEMSISTNNSDALIDAETKALVQTILNAAFLAVCFGWAAYTIFNIDDGMTRGWTQGEIAMRIPLDNWSNYERSLQDKPIFTKTLINVVIYLLGDWLSQTVFQKKDVLDFDVSRTLKNGFIGLCFGPLVHQYYQFSDTILPVENGLFTRVEKILMDQTLYLTIKCSIYIFAVGFLSGGSLETCKTTVKEKIGGVVLTAWKFWPLVHCVTYSVIPAQHRILWVNSVDLIWNAILAKSAQKGDAETEAILEEELKESAVLAITTTESDDPLAEASIPAESLACIKKTIDDNLERGDAETNTPPVVQEVSLIGSTVEISEEGVPVLIADDEERTVVPLEEPAEEGVDILIPK